MSRNSPSKHYDPHLQVDISGTVLHETLLAYHLQFEDVDGNEKKDWIPKSQLADMLVAGDETFTATLPQWLAEKKNLV